MNVVLRWVLCLAAVGLCYPPKPAQASASQNRRVPHLRRPGTSSCRAEYVRVTRGVQHTACKPPNPQCRIRDSGVTRAEMQLIMRMHNRMRSLVAIGRLPGFPPAANMRKLYWHPELAAVAQAHANQCMSESDHKHDHAQARTTVTFDSVGQNALWEANNYDKSKRVWHVHMRNWFAEHRSCPVKTVDSFRARGDGARIGHFTQLVWADTQYIGCGYSYYTLDGVEGDRKYQSFYVCNYAPTGNVFSMPVYQAGPPCSSCPEGLVCDRFSGLCAIP
ncbi:scoloptoxin SSD976-like [Amblyomma americanum]